MGCSRTLQRAALAFCGLFILAGAAPAQDPLGWNSPRALELIERARVRRELPRGDATLQNYQAKGNGYVYFYLDRRESTERTLVKVDQIALDLYWQRPNLTKQRIVGLRDVSRLPNRMYYHLDHLTVVQNGFGDVIRIGDGDEVRDVPHPAAPGADSIYDYRLADSVTLQLGGGQPQVRVYQLSVRPRRYNRSALIGSVFVDRASADIVRMTFTFTPASYVDRRLDYINISLDNGLFGGKYWLPNEQSVEIRRQIPELDFAAGAVIKGRLRVSNYAFNEPIPDSVFFGRPVSAAPEAARKSYAFPDDIYAGVIEEGLAPPPQMAELRAQAAELLHENRLSGLPPWRLYIPNASAVLRRNTLEGWYAGLGAAYVPSPTFRIAMTGGYAFLAARPEATVALHAGRVSARAYYNEARDVGPVSGMPGALNTLSYTFGGRDYTNQFFTRGASVSAGGLGPPGWPVHAGVLLEKHTSPFADWVRTHPDVELPTPGRAVGLQAGIERPFAERGRLLWHAALNATAAQFDSDFESQNSADRYGTFAQAILQLAVRSTSEDKRRDLNATLLAGRNFGDTPAQYHFFVGGRETLPGYDYRGFVSDTVFALGSAEYAHTLYGPWIRLRGLAYTAYTRERQLRVNGDSLSFGTEPHVRASVGAGVSLLWDVIRIDVVKGAHWQTLFSVRRDFWDMM